MPIPCCILSNNGNDEAIMTEKTLTCFCEEFSQRGKKKTGYCGVFLLPTWKSTLKKCHDEALSSMGPFCFYECPFEMFSDPDMSCDDTSNKITHIMDCPEFTLRLCMALSGGWNPAEIECYYYNKQLWKDQGVET
jgi:hypothetical protein